MHGAVRPVSTRSIFSKVTLPPKRCQMLSTLAGRFVVPPMGIYCFPFVVGIKKEKTEEGL